MIEQLCDISINQAHSFSDQASFLDLIDSSLQQILPIGSGPKSRVPI
jgi:hypothetical protein